jgi:hypothetical protein
MLNLKLYHSHLGAERPKAYPSKFFLVKSNLFITSKHLSAYLLSL